MSEEQEHIDHCVTYLFNQGLTQAEIALCPAITDNLHVSVRNLKRKLARLQLYWRCNLSEPDVVVNYIAINYVVISGKQSFVTFTSQENYPVILGKWQLLFRDQDLEFKIMTTNEMNSLSQEKGGNK